MINTLSNFKDDKWQRGGEKSINEASGRQKEGTTKAVADNNSIVQL